MAVLNPVLYLGTYAGDGEIHLVFARNFANGFPLQFNVGEPSSGESSIAFMLALASIMSIAGEYQTPLIVKLVSILVLWAIALTGFTMAYFLFTQRDISH